MPQTTDLDFGDLDTLKAWLKAGGIRSVDVDPAKVQTPGVWIRPVRVSLNDLAGVTIGLELIAVVANTGAGRDLPELAALFNKVKAVLDTNGIGGPDDDARLVSVTLPGSSSPLPGLAIPLDLYTTS